MDTLTDDGERITWPSDGPGVEEVRRLYALGELEDVLTLARFLPNAEVKSFADSATLRLRRRYQSRLGAMSRRVFARPVTTLSAHLDARGAYLLSRADDGFTLRDLVEASGIPELDALRSLVALVECGLLVVEETP